MYINYICYISCFERARVYWREVPQTERGLRDSGRDNQQSGKLCMCEPKAMDLPQETNA